ncbi:MAG: peptidoglycan-binding protein [Pseudomonadota bacterium]
MASKASWQTSARGGAPDNPAEDQWHERRFEALDSPLPPQVETPYSEPMDQRTVEALLRRLVDRVEETERRYGQALDELHSRLDQLSQTTSAARNTSSPETADTFDRLHEQVSSLAQRLESEPKTHLDDFERLGQALSGGLRRDLDEAPVAPREEPAPSPFAQSIQGHPGVNRLAPELAPPEDWSWDPKPAAAPADFDNRLTEMANRLEQSIGAAMPSSTIEALNARLEEVGQQIAQSLETAPSRTALEHVEQQISDMGRQLSRAEEQLGRLGGVEERLLQLLSRLENKDEAPKTPEIDAEQLQEIAAKAAVEAARLVADDSQKTTDRLEAMQRELNAVGDTSRQADDRLNSSLQSVHESLKQLVQQVERPVIVSPQTNPFVAKAERKRPIAARPAGAKPTPASKPAPAAKPIPTATAPNTTSASHAASEAAPISEAAPAPSQADPQHVGADDAESRVKETLRDRLDAAGTKAKPRNLLAAFEQARAPHVEQARPAPAEDLGQEFDAPPAPSASDDMVAAARRAAQAAAAQAAALAESREERPVKREPRIDLATDDKGRSRRRPYLIICAAVLLTISALLLYGRLGSKTQDELNAVPLGGAALPADKPMEPAPAAENATAPAEVIETPAEQESGAFEIYPIPEFAPVPGAVPLHDRVGDSNGVTDIPKSQGQVTPTPQLASLTSDDTGSLPADVVFSVEEPESATEVALAEKLAASSVKGPLPPEAIGSKGLREAAASGNPIAQYTVGLSYIDGRGVKANPKTGSEWMERAARSGLAPAQYRLGAMYERGVGVTADIDTARSWYLAAAERGNIKAMHNLAVSVSGGGGATPNYALAAKWYSEAARRGLADSQFNLGILAEHGLGQTKDLAKAYEWYVLAAKQGDTEAQKRRDIVAAQLSSKTIVEVDGKLANWKPKAVSPEANTVSEPASWGSDATSAKSSTTPQANTLVSRAQTLLNKLGYDVGAPDGLAGEKTRAGVKRFQERNAMTQTGEITVELVAQLEALAS